MTAVTVICVWGYTYHGDTHLCAGSVICVSLLRAPQYSTFACCLIPVLTLVVLLVMLDDIDDISFSKRRYFLIVSWMSISVYCIPTRDTHITRDMCMGIHISRGYTYHCDTATICLCNLGLSPLLWPILPFFSPSFFRAIGQYSEHRKRLAKPQSSHESTTHYLKIMNEQNVQRNKHHQ